MTPIDELARRCGVGGEYEDYQGRRKVVSEDSRRRLLHALGWLETPDADPGDALRRATEEAWRETAPPAVVVHVGRLPVLEIAAPASPSAPEVAWTLRPESGARRSGSLLAADVVSRAAVDGRLFERRRIELPLRDVPCGYHDLELSIADGAPVHVSMIVAPQRCWLPPAMPEGARGWGVAVQLYALRSADDWGLGDFGDLRLLIEHAAHEGADFVGLNPIHALHPARPMQCSPYGPSSRAFLNVLYIDVPAVPELAECEPARQMVTAPEFVEAVAQLRAADLVDYAGVAALKLEVLRELHATFRVLHRPGTTARVRAFDAFVAGGGEPLAIHALHDALSARFEGRPWRSWPGEWQDPRGEACRRFAATHADEVGFFLYLQWLADEQLERAHAEALARGMRIGVYRDLAVGVDPDGADAWAAQSLYRTGASIGAPPDALALQGQDWGLPPIDPRVLRARAYRDFIHLVRANMRHCGALRIDHVMGMLRLWWVPRGLSSEAGAYVSYPFEDLLGILALESERNRCMVIGEDLGTVPERIRRALPEARVCSYRVLYFEKESDATFKPPAAYSRLALAAVATHDLATLASYWEGADLALRDRLRLFPGDDVRSGCYAERASDRRALLQALSREGLLPFEQDPGSAAYGQMSFELAAAIHLYVARTPSILMSVQAEDLLLMRELVNLPGTSTEHPNWQRKISAGIEELFGSARVRALCARLRAERPR